MELTGFFFLPFSWLIQNLEHTPTAEIGFHSRVTGDLKGELYLCFSRETAMELISMEMKRKRTIRKFFLNKVDESFLSELTNILINTSWHSLHEGTADPLVVNAPGHGPPKCPEINPTSRQDILL